RPKSSGSPPRLADAMELVSERRKSVTGSTLTLSTHGELGVRSSRFEDFARRNAPIVRGESPVPSPVIKPNRFRYEPGLVGRPDPVRDERVHKRGVFELHEVANVGHELGAAAGHEHVRTQSSYRGLHAAVPFTVKVKGRCPGLNRERRLQPPLEI